MRVNHWVASVCDAEVLHQNLAIKLLYTRNITALSGTATSTSECISIFLRVLQDITYISGTIMCTIHTMTFFLVSLMLFSSFSVYVPLSLQGHCNAVTILACTTVSAYSTMRSQQPPERSVLKLKKVTASDSYIARLTGTKPDQPRFTIIGSGSWSARANCAAALMPPSIERANEQLDPRQQLANTPPTQSTTPGLHPLSIHQMAPPKRTSDCSLLLNLLTQKDERLVGWPVADDLPI